MDGCGAEGDVGAGADAVGTDAVEAGAVEADAVEADAVGTRRETALGENGNCAEVVQGCCVVGPASGLESWRESLVRALSSRLVSFSLLFSFSWDEGAGRGAFVVFVISCSLDDVCADVCVDVCVDVCADVSGCA